MLLCIIAVAVHAQQVFVGADGKEGFHNRFAIVEIDGHDIQIDKKGKEVQ